MESIYTFSGDPAGAIFGAVAGALAVIGVFALVFIVLEIIAMWRIFKKAGKHGWAAIIPIYNQVTLFNVAGMSGWWTLAVIAFAILGNLAQNISYNGDSTSGAILSIIAGIGSLVLFIYTYIRIAKAFGKGTGFAIGLILLNPIFMMILGFGAAKYSAKALKASSK